MNRADMFCRIELIKIRLIRNMRAGARLGADGEDSETTCQHKKKNRKAQSHKSHTLTCTHKHSCGYEGVSWQAWGQNNFLRFVMWNPTGILMTGSRDPGTMGVSWLCLKHILFIILFCSGGRKFAQAKDSSTLIISALVRDCKLCKFTDGFFFSPFPRLRPPF